VRAKDERHSHSHEEGGGQRYQDRASILSAGRLSAFRPVGHRPSRDIALEVVGVQVAVGLEGAELQDGFGDLDALAGAGDVHAVFDQVAPGASMTPVEMGYPAARA